jgi:hypothetical protein
VTVWHLVGAAIAIAIALNVRSVWVRWRNEPCDGHEGTCAGCRRGIRVIHVSGITLIGHDPPQCHWFTQKMERLARDNEGGS